MGHQYLPLRDYQKEAMRKVYAVPNRGTREDVEGEFKYWREREVPAGTMTVLVVVGGPLSFWGKWLGRVCLWVLGRLRGVEVVK